MSRLLYIRASPRGERSYSLRVADAFAEAYRQVHPTDEIVTIDLFQKSMPPFDGFALQAKYNILHGEDHSDEERSAWRAVENIIAEFTSADKYLLATPMWNFHLPYPLKHYIDIIVQPGYTFAYSPEEGYSGLVTGKPVLFVCARGGDYSPGSETESFDLQTRYLETIFGFMGFEDMQKLVVEPTLSDPQATERLRQRAVERAQLIAKSF